jgi:hypothetical protein
MDETPAYPPWATEASNPKETPHQLRIQALRDRLHAEGRHPFAIREFGCLHCEDIILSPPAPGLEPLSSIASFRAILGSFANGKGLSLKSILIIEAIVREMDKADENARLAAAETDFEDERWTHADRWVVASPQEQAEAPPPAQTDSPFAMPALESVGRSLGNSRGRPGNEQDHLPADAEQNDLLASFERIVRRMRKIGVLVGELADRILVGDVADRFPDVLNGGEPRAAVLSDTREKAIRLAFAYNGEYRGITAYPSADAIRGTQWEIVIVDAEAWRRADIREAALLAARRGPRPRVLVEVGGGEIALSSEAGVDFRS